MRLPLMLQVARGRDPVEAAPPMDYKFNCIGVDSPKTITGKLSVDFTLPAAIGNNAGEAKEWLLDNVLSLLERFNESVKVAETKEGAASYTRMHNTHVRAHTHAHLLQNNNSCPCRENSKISSQ